MSKSAGITSDGNGYSFGQKDIGVKRKSCQESYAPFLAATGTRIGKEILC